MTSSVLSRPRPPLNRNTFVACFLAGSLDAFDFFILVFCVSALAADFHIKVSVVLEAISLRWPMRPVGAFLVGFLADRYGRRPALMIDIICFSIFELGSAFAPSFHWFLISVRSFRHCHGRGMGGRRRAGVRNAARQRPWFFFPGFCRKATLPVPGNSSQPLSMAVPISLHRLGEGMFVFCGTLPALLVIYIRSKVDESPAWLQGRAAKKKNAHVGTARHPRLSQQFSFRGLADGCASLL